MADITVTKFKNTETDEEAFTEEDGLKVYSDDSVKTIITVNSSGILESKKGGDATKTYAETGGGLDTTAIHVDTANEITGITEETTPADDDVVVIEDISDSGNKKKVEVSNLPLGDIDGGSASSVYLVAQVIEGGSA